MEIAQAKKIGRKQALIVSGIGVLTAQLIIILFLSVDIGIFKSFFWFLNSWFSSLVALVVLYFSARVIGQLAGKSILVKKRNPYLIGLLTRYAVVLITTTLSAAIIGLTMTRYRYLKDHLSRMGDYLLEAIEIILVFGFIPPLLLGLYFGFRMRRVRSRHKKEVVS